jgi:hypothetical protein
MDASKYRQVMTDLFFHGKEPVFEPEPGKPGKRPPATPKRSKIDELRAFQEAIAARNKPTE